MRYLFLFVLLFSTIAVNADDSIVVSGQFKHNSKYAVSVLEQFRLGSLPIAKAAINKDEGSFRIALPANTPAGIYRLRYSQSTPDAYIDIIVNGEKAVDFTIDLFSDDKRPVFRNSPENSAWYEYQSAIAQLQYEIEVLGGFISSYPDTLEPTVVLAKSTRREKIANAKEVRLAYIRKNKNNISGKYVSNQPLYFADPGAQYQLQAYNYWSGYWQGIDCTDTTLLNTPLYTEHLIGYMQYWVNKDLDFGAEEMTNGFKKSVDTVMKYFGGNAAMKEFAVQYLTNGFIELGKDEIVEYIDMNYRKQQQCETDTALQERLEAYKLLGVGKPAPRIYYTNSAGVEQEFFWNNQDADTIIVAFWATWCPHCMAAMPALDSFAAARKNTRILAVSLDTDAGQYFGIKDTLENMVHYCDFQKWQGKIAEDYHISATPTFYVTDRNGVILSKYGSVSSLMNDL